jgi:hypothetical protein
MRTEEELKQLAKDLLDDKIFTDAHIREGDDSLLGSIFMPIIFIDQKQRDKMEAECVSVLFEYYSKAGPRSINGYPMFTSMNYMTKDEWEKVFNYHEKMKKALDEVK